MMSFIFIQQFCIILIAVFFTSTQQLMNRNAVMLEETKDTITVPAAFMIRMLACIHSLRNRTRPPATGSTNSGGGGGGDGSSSASLSTSNSNANVSHANESNNSNQLCNDAPTSNTNEASDNNSIDNDDDDIDD